MWLINRDSLQNEVKKCFVVGSVGIGRVIGDNLAFSQISRLVGTSGSDVGLARAVAVASDVDVGQLGHRDDRDDGVKSDAENKVLG